MKTPFTTPHSLHLILVLTFSMALMFVGTAYAGALEELSEIFTKDRSKPPATETERVPDANAPPPNYPGTSTPTFRFPDQSKAKAVPAQAGITQCPKSWLRRVGVDSNGNIIYIVGNGTIARLAGNITTPGGLAMLQLLLASPGTDDSRYVGAYYPAGYNCNKTNRTTPAQYLWISLIGL